MQSAGFGEKCNGFLLTGRSCSLGKVQVSSQNCVLSWVGKTAPARTGGPIKGQGHRRQGAPLGNSTRPTRACLAVFCGYTSYQRPRCAQHRRLLSFTPHI
jgi:hypothetical protein